MLNYYIILGGKLLEWCCLKRRCHCISYLWYVSCFLSCPSYSWLYDL